MKRKILFLTMLLAVSGLITMQSCFKDGKIYATFYSFTNPVVVAPEDGATVHLTGTSVDLTWTSTNEDGDPVLADVYFGTSSTPPLYKADHNALSLTVPVEKGITYYWSVTMIDKNGIPTVGPTWSFTIFEPIGIFVGDFTCDEPAEDWSYSVTFSKASDNVLDIDAFWASWPSTFELDFVNNTYSMAHHVWGTYEAEEAGTIDPATGTMVGDYTIWHNAAIIETGTHTYTKD
jgi:hypothetical protein